MSFIGLFLGNGKYMQNYPFGYFGCAISMMGSTSICTITMWIQVLISYERRKAITNISFLSYKARVYTLLVLIFITGFSIWGGFFIGLGALAYQETRINVNTNDTLWVCSAHELEFFGLPGVGETLFGVISFTIPTSLITFNYW